MKDKTKDWVFFAERDILMAETAMNDSRLTGQVAFHSQQAIEKYFKAYLTEFEFTFPKIHDLLKLYIMIKEIKSWNINEELLSEINRVYSASRYPVNICLLANGQLPSTDKAKEILDFAKKIEALFKEELKIPIINTSPKWIKSLNENEIFVFGSNLAGFHGGGAAELAMKWGAVWGQGIGLQGQTYAIPTMFDAAEEMKPYIDEFLVFTKTRPELKFLVTEIGCGIAGFAPKDIAPFFKAVIDENLANVYLPESFAGELSK
jgi:HEPN domain-containing protein